MPFGWPFAYGNDNGQSTPLNGNSLTHEGLLWIIVGGVMTIDTSKKIPAFLTGTFFYEQQGTWLGVEKRASEVEAAKNIVNCRPCGLVVKPFASASVPSESCSRVRIQLNSSNRLMGG